MAKFTVRQWRTLAVLYAANTFVFVAIGLLPPFFPTLATAKGASATQFGIVFGMFRLTMGLIAPVYGRYMDYLGPKLLLCSGVFATSGACMLMGVIEYVDGALNFIGLSSAIQVVAALGTAALTNVNLVLVNKEFPDNSASVFATVETTSGLGNFIGPLLGGILIENGGYMLPFIVVGCVIFLVSVMSVFVLPEPKGYETTNCETSCIESDDDRSQITVWELLKNLAFSLYLYIDIATCFAYGFFLVTLEFHLRPLHMSPVQVSLIFALNSAVYCISCTGHGWLLDNYLRPTTVACWGACIMVIGFLLLGPAPFIPLTLTMPLVIIGTILFSTGNGAQVVASMTGTTREALANGAPDNVATYGLVGGVWNFFFCMSFFIGFYMGGVMLDTIGYQLASMVVVAVVTVGIVTVSGYLCAQKSRQLGYVAI